MCAWLWLCIPSNLLSLVAGECYSIVAQVFMVRIVARILDLWHSHSRSSRRSLLVWKSKLRWVQDGKWVWLVRWVGNIMLKMGNSCPAIIGGQGFIEWSWSTVGGTSGKGHMERGHHMHSAVDMSREDWCSCSSSTWWVWNIRTTRKEHKQ